ncbi:unnamed protein product [Jaminaea pallidilutea]
MLAPLPPRSTSSPAAWLQADKENTPPPSLPEGSERSSSASSMAVTPARKSIGAIIAQARAASSSPHPLADSRSQSITPTPGTSANGIPRTPATALRSILRQKDSPTSFSSPGRAVEWGYRMTDKGDVSKISDIALSERDDTQQMDTNDGHTARETAEQSSASFLSTDLGPVSMREIDANESLPSSSLNRDIGRVRLGLQTGTETEDPLAGPSELSTTPRTLLRERSLSPGADAQTQTGLKRSTGSHRQINSATISDRPSHPAAASLDSANSFNLTQSESPTNILSISPPSKLRMRVHDRLSRDRREIDMASTSTSLGSGESSRRGATPKPRSSNFRSDGSSLLHWPTDQDQKTPRPRGPQRLLPLGKQSPDSRLASLETTDPIPLIPARSRSTSASSAATRQRLASVGSASLDASFSLNDSVLRKEAEKFGDAFWNGAPHILQGSTGEEGEEERGEVDAVYGSDLLQQDLARDSETEGTGETSAVGSNPFVPGQLQNAESQDSIGSGSESKILSGSSMHGTQSEVADESEGHTGWTHTPEKQEHPRHAALHANSSSASSHSQSVFDASRRQIGTEDHRQHWNDFQHSPRSPSPSQSPKREVKEAQSSTDTHSSVSERPAALSAAIFDEAVSLSPQNSRDETKYTSPEPLGASGTPQNGPTNSNASPLNMTFTTALTASPSADRFRRVALAKATAECKLHKSEPKSVTSWEDADISSHDASPSKDSNAASNDGVYSEPGDNHRATKTPNAAGSQSRISLDPAASLTYTPASVASQRHDQSVLSHLQSPTAALSQPASDLLALDLSGYYSVGGISSPHTPSMSSGNAQGRISSVRKALDSYLSTHVSQLSSASARLKSSSSEASSLRALLAIELESKAELLRELSELRWEKEKMTRATERRDEELRILVQKMRFQVERRSLVLDSPGATTSNSDASTSAATRRYHTEIQRLNDDLTEERSLRERDRRDFEVRLYAIRAGSVSPSSSARIGQNSSVDVSISREIEKASRLARESSDRDHEIRTYALQQEHETLVQTLRDELDAVKRQRDEAEDNRQSTVQEVSRMQEELSVLESDVADAEDQRAVTQELEAQNAHLLRCLEEQERAADQKMEELRRHAATELQRQKEHSQDEVQGLMSELTDRSSQLDAAHGELRKLAERVQSLTQQHHETAEAALKHQEHLDREHQSLRAQLAATEAAKVESTSEQQRLSEAMQRLHFEKQELLEQCGRLEAHFLEERSHHEAAKIDVEKLVDAQQQSLAKMDAASKADEAALRSAQNQVKVLETRIESLEREVGYRGLSMTKLERANSKLEAEIENHAMALMAKQQELALVKRRAKKLAASATPASGHNTPPIEETAVGLAEMQSSTSGQELDDDTAGTQVLQRGPAPTKAKGRKTLDAVARQSRFDQGTPVPLAISRRANNAVTTSREDMDQNEEESEGTPTAQTRERQRRIQLVEPPSTNAMEQENPGLDRLPWSSKRPSLNPSSRHGVSSHAARDRATMEQLLGLKGPPEDSIGSSDVVPLRQRSHRSTSNVRGQRALESSAT